MFRHATTPRAGQARAIWWRSARLGAVGVLAWWTSGCATLPISPATEALAEQRCLATSTASLPPRAFTTDGCSAWPDGCWRDCCVAHDIAYWCGGGSGERARADREFRDCLTCRQSAPLAWTMWAGVRVGGHPWWPTPWRWGYGRPWPSGYLDTAETAPEEMP